MVYICAGPGGRHLYTTLDEPPPANSVAGRDAKHRLTADSGHANHISSKRHLRTADSGWVPSPHVGVRTLPDEQ